LNKFKKTNFKRDKANQKGFLSPVKKEKAFFQELAQIMQLKSV